MAVRELGDVLADNGYPGRGVLWARTLDGRPTAGYFLTGRTPASQSRELRLVRDELVVAATGAAEPGRDPLRHYVAARERDGRLVYGNGEQVAEVADRLAVGRSPVEALSGLEYEPDAPVFTPRITAVVDGRGVWFGAARRPRGERVAADVMVLALGELAPGDVVLMTTYRSEGRTPATGEPYEEARTRAADRGALLAEIWDALDPELRVGAGAFIPGELGAAVLRQRGGAGLRRDCHDLRDAAVTER